MIGYRQCLGQFLLSILLACILTVVLKPCPTTAYTTDHGMTQSSVHRQVQSSLQLPNTYTSVDACNRDSDCANGGTCKLKSASDSTQLHNRCNCPHGYGGNLCEEICPLTCQNHGSCRPYSDVRTGNASAAETSTNTTTSEAGVTTEPQQTYECVCFGDFTGDECQIPFTACPDKTLCLHGGKCVLLNEAINEYGCDCPPGFDDGANCAEGSGGDGAELSFTAFEQDVEEAFSPAIVIGIVVGAFLGVTCTFLVIKSLHSRRGYRLTVRGARNQTDDVFDPQELKRDLEMI